MLFYYFSIHNFFLHFVCFCFRSFATKKKVILASSSKSESKSSKSHIFSAAIIPLFSSNFSLYLPSLLLLLLFPLPTLSTTFPFLYFTFFILTFYLFCLSSNFTFPQKHCLPPAICLSPNY